MAKKKETDRILRQQWPDGCTATCIGEFHIKDYDEICDVVVKVDSLDIRFPEYDDYRITIGETDYYIDDNSVFYGVIDETEEEVDLGVMDSNIKILSDGSVQMPCGDTIYYDKVEPVALKILEKISRTTGYEYYINCVEDD